jgi:hypothetical protein
MKKRRVPRALDIWVSGSVLGISGSPDVGDDGRRIEIPKRSLKPTDANLGALLDHQLYKLFVFNEICSQQ